MKKKAEHQWICGCGETNTGDKCTKCGELKGDRKDFVVCEKCHEVYFSDKHTCKKQ